MVVVAQLVRALVCGAGSRRFEPGHPPKNAKALIYRGFFCLYNFLEMKKIFLLLLFPLVTLAQTDATIDKTIKLKVAIMQNFVAKGEEGETLFWQTKGKVTYAIVNYTEEQNPQFKALFIAQYQELLGIYKRMIVSEDEKDTALYVKTLVRQEEDYRNLLTPMQLKLYLEKLTDFEKNNPEASDSYSSLFFSENLLKEYKSRFTL